MQGDVHPVDVHLCDYEHKRHCGSEPRYYTTAQPIHLQAHARSHWLQQVSGRPPLYRRNARTRATPRHFRVFRHLQLLRAFDTEGEK